MNNDISLRDELFELFNIDVGSISYIPYIHRSLKKDTSNNSIKCYCWDISKAEGKAGCPNCDGIGYVWTEKIIPGYLFFITTTDPLRNLKTTTPGRHSKYESGFITTFENKLHETDRIYVPHLTNEGYFRFPITMKEQYYVVTSKDNFLDGGRSEFMMAYLQREK